MTQVEELSPVECLFVGRRVLASGKLAEGYVPVETVSGIPPDDWDRFEAEVSLFAEAKRSKAAPRTGAVVGGVYKMDVKVVAGRITTAKTGSREFLRRHEDKTVVAACEVRDNAASMHVRSTRIMNKLKGDSMLAQELRMLRGLYKRTPYADRMALELVVLNALRKETV